MKQSTKYSSSLFLQFFAKLQELVANIAYPLQDRLPRVERVCAVDAAVKSSSLSVAAVVYELESDSVVESVVDKFDGELFPYVPGFLALREGPAMLNVLQRLKTGFDVLLVDGHGRAHPRRCGIATLLGFAAGTGSVGIAKSILVGELRPVNDYSELVVGDEVVGLCRGKFVYSQGFGVSFNDLRKVFDLFNGGYPKPLRLADKMSKETFRGK
ncbi:MAG: endonuclease V [Candidatus Caldarchaeum sp.]